MSPTLDTAASVEMVISQRFLLRGHVSVAYRTQRALTNAFSKKLENPVVG
jgi:hypothetical protein